MTQGGWPRYCWLLAAMCIASGARAGVWTTDPVLGLAADYETNPGLLFVPHDAETHGDILIDAPTTYHANSFSFSALPSFRLSNSPGYSSLASDYEHLTTVAELDTERDSLTLTGQFAQDSSLYYESGFNGSTGVKRDTVLGDLNWQRALTERLNTGLEINSSRVNYGRSLSGLSLVDFRYTSAAPSLSWNLSERTTLNVVGGVGFYNSSDGATKSINSNLELGASGQITELWTIAGKAGLSHETDTEYEYYGPYLLDTFRSTDTSTVFMASIARQGLRSNLNVSASRSLVPSGNAFLSRQDAYTVNFQYTWTPRWTFNSHAQRVSAQEEQAFGPPIDQTFWNVGLSAAWMVTEKWTLSLAATKVNIRYTSILDVASTGLTLQLSRRFDTIKWQ
jgi:hypothetical protein